MDDWKLRLRLRNEAKIKATRREMQRPLTPALAEKRALDDAYGRKYSADYSPLPSGMKRPKTKKKPPKSVKSS